MNHEKKRLWGDGERDQLPPFTSISVCARCYRPTISVAQIEQADKTVCTNGSCRRVTLIATVNMGAMWTNPRDKQRHGDAMESEKESRATTDQIRADSMAHVSI